MEKTLKDLISIDANIEMQQELKYYVDEVTIDRGSLISHINGTYVQTMSGYYVLDGLVNIFDSIIITSMITSVGDPMTIITMDIDNKFSATGVLRTYNMSKDNLSEDETDRRKSNLLSLPLGQIGLTDLHLHLDAGDLKDAENICKRIYNTKTTKETADKKQSYHLGLVTLANGAPNLDVTTVDFKTPYSDLELLYNNITVEFHNTLMEKLHTSTKGNIILHGMPGTGKSYYIRKLIKDYHLKYEANAKDDEDSSDEDDLDYVSHRVFQKRRAPSNIKKLFVYIPTNLSHIFADPSFTSMLQSKAATYPRGMVLILEDAETVIGSRESGHDTGVGTLLGMGDGILNDIVNTQFIFTYNTKTEKVDDALLRSGRLVAKKEFGKLTKDKANELAKLIGSKETFDAPTELSTIFASIEEEENSILIDKKIKKGKIGF